MVLPLVGALLCFALRGRPRLATALAGGTLVIGLVLVLAAPETQLTLLGLTYRLDEARRLAAAALFVAVLALLGLDRLVGRGRKFGAVSLAVAGAGAGTLLLADARAG